MKTDRVPVLLFLFFLICMPLAVATQAQQMSPRVTYPDLVDNLVSLDALSEPPVFKTAMASSFDRLGGNRDGEGYIRREGEHFVVAEMNGPGVITRIWSANPLGMVRIYLDNDTEPVVQRHFRDLFLGTFSPFRKPFVRAPQDRHGAHWSVVPISFQEYCRITLTDLCYYQIEYITYPIDTPIDVFSMPLSDEHQRALNTAANSFAVPDRKSEALGRDGTALTWKGSLAAGQREEIATVNGPAVLRSLLMRWPENREESGRDLLLMMYWDDETEPSILTTVSDFFGGPVQTRAVGRLPDGWGYVRFPMPFRSQARIVLENGSESEAHRVEVEARVEPVESLPYDTRYFHAYWHRNIESSIAPVSIDSRSGEILSRWSDLYVPFRSHTPGHMVGVSSMVSPNPHSDVMVSIDQADWPPAMPGTGQYGFFNLDGDVALVNGPLSGSRPTSGGLMAAVRLFYPFPVAYLRRFELGFEHGHANLLRQDQSVVVYWYQDEPHTPLTWPLPTAARRFRTTSPHQPVWSVQDTLLVPETVLEVEQLPILAANGIYETRDMTVFGADWSANQTMEFEAPGPSATFQVEMPPVEYSGLYQIESIITRSPGSGYLKINVDEHEVVQAVDLYHPETMPGMVESQEPFFLHASDTMTVTFSVVGKNPQATGYTVGVDRLAFKPTEWVPDTIDVTGPFADQAGEGLEWIDSAAHSDFLPGIGYANPDDLSTETLEVSKEQFSLRMTDGQPLRWITLTVTPPASGIYRMEVHPTDAVPFLLEQLEEAVQRVEERLLINGIPLRSDGVTRLNPETLSRLPVRFSIPMNEGENRISFLLDTSAATSIRPVIYGVE